MTNQYPKLINIPETAKLLNVSTSVIRTWLSRKQVFPSKLIIKLGRRTLFHYQNLLDWIDNGCKVPTKDGKVV